MSLLPFFLDEYPVVPRRDLVSLFSPEEALRPFANVFNQLANLEKDNSIIIDKDHFQSNIDVQQFKPEEIKVKLNDDNSVTVEGKHEEKQDEHGYISRHFVRRYVLPKDCDVKKLQSKLSSDGVLTISAPKKSEGKQIEYRQIPIIRTGPVEKVTHQKSQENQEQKSS